MSRIVLPSGLASNLLGCDSRTALCDEGGAVIGYFEPAISRDKTLYDWLAKEVTTEELDRAAKDGGNATTAEIKAKLGSLS